MSSTIKERFTPMCISPKHTYQTPSKTFQQLLENSDDKMTYIHNRFQVSSNSAFKLYPHNNTIQEEEDRFNK